MKSLDLETGVNLHELPNSQTCNTSWSWLRGMKEGCLQLEYGNRTILLYHKSADLSEHLKITSRFSGTNGIVPIGTNVMFFDH